MEHLDDKVIRNKIDSLDSLPDGYEPSLQSKWELLENALPEKKNNNRKFILAIAASVILLLGFSGFMFLNLGNENREIALEKAVKEKANNIEIEQQKANKSELQQSENPEVLQPEIHKNKDLKMAEKVAVNNKEKKFHAIKDSVSESVIPKEILPENNLVSTSLKPKKSKKLYVEIDFNDAPKVQPKRHENLAENKVKFKVSIFKNKEKNAETAPQNTVLKFSKEFPINN